VVYDAETTTHTEEAATLSVVYDAENNNSAVTLSMWSTMLKQQTQEKLLHSWSTMLKQQPVVTPTTTAP
jgi:hypothetical protein